MFDPEESRPVNDARPGEQTDRVNGEYHYKNGYTQRIYSDAHYVRADQSTTPPRYYVPPERTARESRGERPRRGVSLGAGIACGMAGTDGAVSHVRWDGDAPELEVIGGGTPRGLCGSGFLTFRTDQTESARRRIRSRLFSQPRQGSVMD